ATCLSRCCAVLLGYRTASFFTVKTEGCFALRTLESALKELEHCDVQLLLDVHNLHQNVGRLLDVDVRLSINHHDPIAVAKVSRLVELDDGRSALPVRLPDELGRPIGASYHRTRVRTDCSAILCW